MRCKTCDYLLWNLPARRCPECGTPFVPSEFELVPNQVQYCCPHCDQAYYGTDGQGHLVPRAFDCVSCGQAIDMDDMVLRPAEGVSDEQTQPERMPWLDRGDRGFFRSWLSTIWMAMVSPGRLIQLLPLQSSASAAWGFLLVTYVATLALMFGPILIFQALIMMVTGMAGGPGPGMFFSILGLGGIGVIIAAVILTCLMVGLWGALTHGLLRLTAGSGPPPKTIDRTYQALCYSSGANVSSIVPCVGSYFGWIWWVVSAVLMVREIHRIPGGRAAFAVITPPAIALLTCIGAYVLFFFAVITGSGPFGGIARLLDDDGSYEAGEIVTALTDYARDHEGHWPGHAIELVDADLIHAWDLIGGDTNTFIHHIPTGDLTLSDFDNLAPQRRRALVRAMVDALPEDVVAHRFGDFVFTYHGIDLETADPALWLVIFSPDPDVNPVTPGTPRRTMAIGTAGGEVITRSAFLIAPALVEQNALREAHGLPPLPDPSTVTHDRPARASDPVPFPTTEPAP